MNVMQDCPVTICIPSHRPLALARGPLESAIRFAGERNYRVVISDNSGEGAKLHHFSDLPGYVTYLFDETRPPIANLRACLDAANTPFILPMGDDDFVDAVEGEAAFDFAALGPDVAGVRPLVEVFAHGEGVLRSHSFAIEAATPPERLSEYRQKISGDNTLYYSYFRLDDFREMLGMLDDHPISTGDMDWALVYSLVANGRVLYDPSTRYRYDVGKWRWTEGIEASIRDIYRQADLPDAAIAFEHIFRFLDCYVFAFRRTWRHSEVERIKSLYAAAVIFLGRTLHSSEQHPERFTGFEPEIAMLRAVLKEPDDYLVNVFEVCARIADRLKPGLFERYIHWFASARARMEAQ